MRRCQTSIVPLSHAFLRTSVICGPVARSCGCRIELRAFGPTPRSSCRSKPRSSCKVTWEGRLSHLVAGILILALWPALPTGGWVRVDTPHFVVFGQSSEKTTETIATEFERFREAIGRVLPLAVIESPVPTVV